MLSNKPPDVPPGELAQIDYANSNRSSQTSRRLQHVMPLATKLVILTWKESTEIRDGEQKFASKTICHFPQYCRESVNANIVRAMRLWDNRSNFQDDGTSVFLKV